MARMFSQSSTLRLKTRDLLSYLDYAVRYGDRDGFLLCPRPQERGLLNNAQCPLECKACTYTVDFLERKCSGQRIWMFFLAKFSQIFLMNQ